MPIKRNVVFEAITGEREYQNKKWGDPPHEVAAYILYMEHHLSKARRLSSEQRGDENSLDELRKVVTLGVACMEQHGVVWRDPNAPIKFHDAK